MSRSRSYVYTLNNYTPEEELYLQQELECLYMVYGREKGESQTPHLQGFVYFGNARSFTAVCKLLPRAHVEICKSVGDAIQYCRKDGDVFEKGKEPMKPAEKGQLEKVRYKRAWDLAKEGRIEEVDSDILIRHYNTLKRIKSDYQEQPLSQAELSFYWYWGPSGSGKSKRAREEYPVHYLKMPNKWWDGYKDQPCVIIDEWSPNHEVLADHLKRWADHHPFAAESKGSTICIRPGVIIITSNYSMQECFSKNEDLQPLRRRFKEILID